MKRIIEAGTKFGRLTFIEEKAERNKSRQIVCVCKCDCGKLREVIKQHLFSGNTKSCGCRLGANWCEKNPIKEGDRFGKLTVIARAKSNHAGKVWLCRCDCGTMKEIPSGRLKKGDAKSCGCSQYPPIAAASNPHYVRWVGMKQRCFNKNATDYRSYGGRGITVCSAWLDFHVYRAYIEQLPDYQEGMTIDRTDNDGNYEPGNVRWATPSQQIRNSRTYKGLS